MYTVFRGGLLVLLLYCGTVQAQQDAYHTHLQRELETVHHISGGAWMFSETEETTLSLSELDNVTEQVRDNDDTRWPFTRYLEIRVPEQRANPWDNRVRFPIQRPVKSGDALLLAVWLNTIEAEHPLALVFEAANPPHTQSLNQEAFISPGWELWLLPFEAQTDYNLGEAHFQLNLGTMRGMIQLGGLALFNFGKKYPVKDLPSTTHHLSYTGRASEAAWRQEALNRIEEIRKGDLYIHVVNRYDQPIIGARVNASMQQHDFGFGTSVTIAPWLRQSYDGDIYKSKLEDLTGYDRSFNVAVVENAHKWPPWEDPQEWGTKSEATDLVRWLVDRNMRVRGHNLLWPGWGQMPDDLQAHQNDPNYLMNRVRTHIFEIVRYHGLKGILSSWDVLNEPVFYHDLIDALGEDTIYADAFRWARQGDASPTLYVNENGIISRGGTETSTQETYHEIIERLMAQGAPLDGIGMQAHMKNSFTPPERILSVLDDFARHGKEISITEFDMNTSNGDLAADYMRDFLIATFSHPTVRNFIMWGFWDGNHWLGDSPIFEEDWSLKPSGIEFVRLVFRDWWSDGKGVTNFNGRYEDRLFYGEYHVSATFDGQTVTDTIRFDKDHRSFAIKINTKRTTPFIPPFFRIEQNVPNPFNDVTSIRYAVPTDSHVTIDLYDVRGRYVMNVLDAPMSAGWHTVSINAGRLPSGVYYYRMRSGSYTTTRKLLLLN